MNDHFLQTHYKGWSLGALEEQKLNIIRFDGSKTELAWIEREIERRKEAEEVA